MAKLEIYEDPDKVGENLWYLHLISESGKTLLRSEKSLQKGEILSIAKKVRHGSSNIAFLDKESEEIGADIWFEFCSDKDDKWCVCLKMVDGHVLTTIEGCVSKEDLEKLFVEIKQEIEKIKDKEIVWNPPEADPAKPEKDCDETETLGIPGS